MTDYDDGYDRGHEDGYASGRAIERERIAAMVEELPTHVWTGIDDPIPYRARTPVEIAKMIRGDA